MTITGRLRSSIRGHGDVAPATLAHVEVLADLVRVRVHEGAPEGGSLLGAVSGLGRDTRDVGVHVGVLRRAVMDSGHAQVDPFAFFVVEVVSPAMRTRRRCRWPDQEDGRS